MDIQSIPFQVFGSHDSTDYDVMLFVDTIPDAHASKQLCNAAEVYLADAFTSYGWETKKMNANLAVITDGVVTKVFKGTVDEVNNSLILTYNLHQQRYPLLVQEMVARDVEIKVLRTFRVILSFISRTQYRVEVKHALRGDLTDKVKVARSIQLAQVDDLGKDISILDYHKTLAFQFGQTLALLEDGTELYSKESIASHYPLLRPFLYREQGDLQTLQQMQDALIERTEKIIPQMSNLKEY